ncbi:uncharacterized protein LOC122300455 isoform X1 [Carya illinoinensis]|uniref:Adenylyl cyclase n=1 Tax=Carya illinoinensis TaxID=32201 RepID=A0A8T1RCI7_CARIL|nr:uncharacterized protein LOC122300455 isoform X1 [Carya illinoinensis]KAG6664335.1 hypothetical protein CIPAW_02G086000 [Carya illinoinensis]
MRGLSARSLQHPPEFTQNELVLRSDLTRPLEAMQVVLNARRLSRAFKSPILLNSHRFLAPDIGLFEAPPTPRPCRIHRGLSSQIPWSSDVIRSNHLHTVGRYLVISRACFSSEASTTESSPTEAVKELYDRMLESVVSKRSMPPNAWLWSLLENCKSNDDIKLLFDILQNLRRFRLSNLRIHADFNCNLCREITKTCVRVGALDYGKKALWKHNLYGLAPSIGSAHHLLLYAKSNNDAKLMVDIMKLIKRNDLPLQPGTVDIIFSICYNTDNWQLMSKYSKKFIKAGVKLRQTSFDAWMEFAAKIGDTETLWKIEKLRSESMRQHTLVSGFSCAKGFLLEHKPEDAAAIIQVLHQSLSDAKKSGIMIELQKLVSEWTVEVIKRQKKEDRKALAESLKSDIPAMVSGLLNMGIEASVSIKELTGKEGILY